MLSAIPYVGNDLVIFIWGGFAVCIKCGTTRNEECEKTLLNAGKPSILELRYLLSNHYLFNNLLIKNNVKILNSRSKSAGVCVNNFTSDIGKAYVTGNERSEQCVALGPDTSQDLWVLTGQLPTGIVYTYRASFLSYRPRGSFTGNLLRKFRSDIDVVNVTPKEALPLSGYRGKASVTRPFNFIRQVHSTASQRLHAKDMAWLVGFVEGDGWFCIAKNGNYCKYEFGIELSKRDIQLLYKMKNLLGVGVIQIRKSNLNAIFRIRSKFHLKNIILPIFDTYPMFTAKHWDYINFRNNLLENVVLYKNLKLYNRPNHTPYESISNILSSSYFNNWLVGFIEAEGCFSIYKPFNQTNNTVSFEIGQKNGLQILNAIKTYLSITANPYTDKTNCVHLKTTSVKGIQNLIKFLSKTDAKLKGYKRLQYLLFLKELRVNDRYKTLDIPMRYGE